MVERWVEYRDRPSWVRKGVATAALAAAALVAWWILRSGAGEGDPFSREVDRIVEEAMEAGPIAGVSVVVSRGWRVLHAKGYGYADVENRILATPQTIYNIGSITKQFTAAAVMEQVGEGTLALDLPVTQYLDEELSGRLAHLSGVTLHHLLGHTSGIPDYTMRESSWRVLGLEMTPLQVLDYFDDPPLEFEPGTSFSYSNSGYVLAGLVLEAVTDRPYGGLLNASILVPHGLSSTAYCDDRRLVPNRAEGYDLVDGEFVHARHVSMSQIYAAGAVCSSATDLARWVRVLTRGEVGGERGFERMTTPGSLADGTKLEYGYGLSVSFMEGRHRIGHVGGFLGFMGQLAYYRDSDLTVIVLTNTEGSAAAQMESAIARLALDLGAHETRDLELSEEELLRYVGGYDVGPTTVQIVAADGRLHADVRVPRLAGRHTLLYQGELTFVAEEDAEVVLTFEADDAGRVGGFELRNRGIVMSAVRVPGA